MSRSCAKAANQSSPYVLSRASRRIGSERRAQNNPVAHAGEAALLELAAKSPGEPGLEGADACPNLIGTTMLGGDPRRDPCGSCSVSQLLFEEWAKAQSRQFVHDDVLHAVRPDQTHGRESEVEEDEQNETPTLRSAPYARSIWRTMAVINPLRENVLLRHGRVKTPSTSPSARSTSCSRSCRTRSAKTTTPTFSRAARPSDGKRACSEIFRRAEELIA